MSNQIGVDGDLLADLSSAELNSFGQVGEVEVVTKNESTEVSSTVPTVEQIELNDQDKSKTANEQKSATKSQSDDDKVEYEYRVIYLPINSPDLNQPNCGCSSAKFNPEQLRTGCPHMLGNVGQIFNDNPTVSSQMPMQMPSAIPPPMLMPPSPPMSPSQRSPMFIRMPPPPPMSITIPMPVPMMSQQMGLQFIPQPSPPQISIIPADTSNDDESSTTATPKN